MKHFILPVLLFLFSAPVSAQVLNVEKVRGEADTTGWAGELGFNLSLSKFNDRILKMGGQANVAYFFEEHASLLLSNIDLVNIDGASLISTGYIHSRTTFLRKNKVSPEFFIQYQYNNNLGLKNRMLTGGSLRFTFLDRPDLTGNISTGLMYEYEEWETADERSVENNFIKSTSNIVLRGQLNPQTSLLIIGYYQARPDRFFQPRATSENQLIIRISDRLSFAANFSLTYDVAPVTDIPNLTYELKNGLIFSL
ncbi:MAG: DUF481 domain-containing protein [Balneolaceae bacterium]